jgi:putative membrane protein
MVYSNAIQIFQNRLFWYIFLFATVWVNSLVGTTDSANWLIENALTVIALLFLFLFRNKLKFNDLSYFLITVFLCLHVYGSKYTYAENPFGFWMQELFHTRRNSYDRMVHFCFGFLLYLPFREYFLNWLKYPKTLSNFLPIVITLSLSSLYEIIEWLVAAVFFEEQGISYLGTQGDVWDAQKDSALAFLGALLAFANYRFYSKCKTLKKKKNAKISID